ncbi:hypothetical protein [Leptospira wolffii]|uniref:hypothetical protein n=1 Tax=Leptospira wolffii TaxID=409998 RepID=UPI0003092FED|nr:hypothetical protein [Leptospira wolffii]EPG66447.1 hypothetical protein LEP1GSC061_1033 [Leptospira wolffii serovar Khorat str. Khorat-H2]
MLPLRSWIANATTHSGFATFASVTSLAKQARAIANVGTPWSLCEHAGKYSLFTKMNFLDKLLKTVDLWIPDERQAMLDKGKDFEKYVISKFDKNYFTIVDWTRDHDINSSGRLVESNLNPDLKIRYNPTKDLFAVECKFRSNPVKSSKINDYVVNWSKPEQIKRYSDFMKRERIPVFVVIGLSGKPMSPEYMFCLPLASAPYPELFPSVLDKFERDPRKNFFWQNGILK